MKDQSRLSTNIMNMKGTKYILDEGFDFFAIFAGFGFDSSLIYYIKISPLKIL